jgi:hypothetical protein
MYIPISARAIVTVPSTSNYTLFPTPTSFEPTANPNHTFLKRDIALSIALLKALLILPSASLPAPIHTRERITRRVLDQSHRIFKIDWIVDHINIRG